MAVCPRPSQAFSGDIRHADWLWPLAPQTVATDIVRASIDAGFRVEGSLSDGSDRHRDAEGLAGALRRFDGAARISRR